MRSVLVLGLLVATSAAADAASLHHSNARHHASVRHAYGAIPGLLVAPGRAIDPRFPPVLQDQTPSYDDPSKLGGG